jgi:hypothetical protein
MSAGKWTYEELTQLTNDLEEAPGPSMSVSPMVAPVAEPQPQEPEPEPKWEPQHRMPSAFDDLLEYLRGNLFTLDGNNLAFVVLVIVECTFAYAIGKILGAW